MLNVKPHRKLVLAVLVLMVGALIAACVPGDLGANVASTRSDVSALKSDVAAMKAKIDELDKGGQEPKAIERETKDQVIRGRADLLDYRMDYDRFKKALMGTPATKAKQGKPGKPAKPGIVGSELSKLRDALAGTPAKKGKQGKPDTKAKPGLLATRAEVQALSKAIDGIKTQLDRIEAKIGGAAAPAASAKK